MNNSFMMMWQMSSDKNKNVDLNKEIKFALKHYEQKYGKPPSIVLCNPVMKGEIKDEHGFAVGFYKPVLWNLLFIGEE